MQELIKGVASFEAVEQVLYGNSGAVEHRHPTLDLEITVNNRLRHKCFLLPVIPDVTRYPGR